MQRTQCRPPYSAGVLRRVRSRPGGCGGGRHSARPARRTRAGRRVLHGHPRTHTTWHQVAPLLVEAGHTVVCPDLRGYGQSSTPEPDAEHLTYCDRVMANDIVQLMTALGHERSGSPVTTAAATSRIGPRWTTRTASIVWPSLTACPSSRPSSGPTRASPSCGGTGSSSPPTRPNASSPRTRWRCTGRTGTGWATRATRTWSQPSPTRQPCRRCSRTTAPGFTSTVAMTSRPRERPSHPVSHVGRLVQVRRPGNPLWRPRGGLGPVVRATGTPCRHGLWPPHGRRGARAAGRHSRRLLRPVGSIRLTALDSEPPAR